MPKFPMKLISCYAVFLMLCGASSAQGRWMLKNSDGNWKTFESEAEWQKAARVSEPLETAVIIRTDKNISVVYDVQGESGDWRKIDRYLFQANGTLIKLERKFVSVAQDIMLTQTYELDPSGTLTKKLAKEVSLTTKKPKNEKPDISQGPIATKIGQLEFLTIR